MQITFSMPEINRRQFMGCSAALLCHALPAHARLLEKIKRDRTGAADIRGHVFKKDAPEILWKWSREADYYQKITSDKVICGLCPHRCILAPGDRSVCRSRVNLNGTLYSLTYGNPCAIHVDPVEKKPLFHFYPRSMAFSLATTGCNLRCLNCQNWEISQAKPHEVRHQELFPHQAVAAAQSAGCTSIAYTYSEPITFFEYMIDTARLARQKGLKNLWISAGYINRKPLLKLCRVIDGANVNLKSFSDDIYRKLNGARLQPVLNTFKTLHEQGVHFEMTNLVVPGYTDDAEMVKKMCHWIIDHLGPDHPLHFTRFFPRYKLNRLPPTPVATLTKFRELAMKEGIRYVYVGNVPNHEGSHTFCHNCHRLLIKRLGYHIHTYNLSGNRCKFCKTVIPGVWEDNA